MTRNEIADRFGMMWKKSRCNAGVSQEYMAKALGVSKKTIQNYDNSGRLKFIRTSTNCSWKTISSMIC